MEFLHFLEGVRTPFLDSLFQFITYLGQAVPLLVVLCAIYWCIDKKLAQRMSVAFFASGLVLQNLKIFCRIDRPWVLDSTFHPVKSAVSGATGYSFPSGHSQSAAAVWGSIGWHFRRKKRSLAFVLLFLLVGFSRMYLGCHTPKDVITGLCIGLVSVFLVDYFQNRIPDTNRARLCFCLGFSLASALSAVSAFSLLSRGVISPENAKDCITIAGAGIGFSVGWYLERVYIHFTIPESSREKVIRFFVGVVLMMLLKIGLGALSGDNLALKMLEYGVVILFITAGYPALFMRYNSTISSLQI